MTSNVTALAPHRSTGALTFGRGRAMASGMSYRGLSCAGRLSDGSEFVLIAADRETLSRLWAALMPGHPLDVGQSKEVRLFHVSDTLDTGKSA